MVPTGAILPLLAFMALLLAAALCGLAASGHFPHEHRSPALKTRAGAFILFGSLVLSMLCLAIGAALVGRAVPWYALVIGGGAMVLAAPLLLRPLPDVFVNGRAALVTFAGASMLMVVLLLSTLWRQAGQ
jgi:membrane-associated PAP2 superfamily phosphatase